MKGIRWQTAAAAATLLLTACGTAQTGRQTNMAPAGYRLFVRDAEPRNTPIDLIDATSGRVERSLPVGTPSPDWSRLYTVSYDLKRTTLRAIDTHGGNLVAQISFDGGFVLPSVGASGLTGGLSPSGGWLVAQTSGIQNRTDFMLISTSFTERPRRISLPGDFAFDALSNDGQRLYLIESLAAIQPGHYRVRRYDVGAGALNPQVIVDKRELATASMTGTRISGVFAPDGGWQYSLYINEKKGPFIHALNLDQTFAWCVDLPAGGTRQEQMMWSLAMQKDGRALFAVNPTIGKVARIDVTSDGPSNEVSASSSFTPARLAFRAPGLVTDAYAKGIQAGSAALTDNGRTLIATGDSGTVAIDVAHLTLNAKPSLTDPGIESVILSDDGAALYASSWDGPSILDVDPASGVTRDRLQTDHVWILYRAERR